MEFGRRAFSLGGLALALAPATARGQRNTVKSYDRGASDSEIRLGHFCPQSGPAAAYGVIGEAHAAYWKWVNDNGGINGRKIVFFTRDDGYVADRSIEVARRLVEEDQVLCLYNPLGTENNTAIRPYLNEQKIPQLWVSSGAARWANPKQYPWTIGFQPDYRFEAAAYVKHALRANPQARFGLLMQSDAFGEDYLRGVRDVLPDADRRLTVATYEPSAERLDRQIEQLKSSGANVLINVAIPKFAAESIRQVADLNWKPVHYLTNVSLSYASVMRPAGTENTVGIITAAYLKDPMNKVWEKDAEMSVWRSWMSRYLPSADQNDIFYVFAYAVSSLMRETLRRCGDDLTRANVMKQATTLAGVRIPMLLPNLVVRTSPNDYYPISDVQLSQFTGAVWRPLQGYTRNPRTFAEPNDDIAPSAARESTPANDGTRPSEATAPASGTAAPNPAAAPPSTAAAPPAPARN
jgi:branched-chain amino acid transport system substrate-binding protein